MRAGLNQFFTLRFNFFYIRLSFRKNFGQFKEKLMVYYFSVFTIVDALKGGPEKMSPMPFLLNMALLDFQVIF